MFFSIFLLARQQGFFEGRRVTQGDEEILRVVAVSHGDERERERERDGWLPSVLQLLSLSPFLSRRRDSWRRERKREREQWR